jgi:hypothetical protein
MQEVGHVQQQNDYRSDEVSKNQIFIAVVRSWTRINLKFVDFDVIL